MLDTLYTPSQFESLRALEPEEAQRVLLEAHRRVRAGSWYRSRLAWSIIGWAVGPLFLVWILDVILPWGAAGAWLLIPTMAIGMVAMNIWIRRAYVREIDAVLAQRANVT